MVGVLPRQLVVNTRRSSLSYHFLFFGFQRFTVPIAKTLIPALVLKGVQLTEKDIEALEQVFKYCQTYHMSFENTNLNDQVSATVSHICRCILGVSVEYTLKAPRGRLGQLGIICKVFGGTS